MTQLTATNQNQAATMDNGRTKPYVGPHEHIDKAPNQVSRHPPMRESTDRGSHGLSWDVSTMDYIAILPSIFIFS